MKSYCCSTDNCSDGIKQYRNILMLYPNFEGSYWGMQYSLPIIRRKSLMPPLGLLTIAAMTPSQYQIRLIDMNTTALNDEDIGWADMVLFSAMLVQKPALLSVADRCRVAGKLVVFGGPYPTSCPEECSSHSDVLVLDEGEMTWPLFLADLESGHFDTIYRSPEKPDITQTPAPRFDLLNTADYVSIPIQFSRGCPFLCEFCDIIVLFGRRPRTKTPSQLLRELDALLATGYRGQVFIVDDNFIGNKKKVLELLPELANWNRVNGNPFSYGTEASVNLAEDSKLLSGMVEAGFIFVFIGIETPSAESLKETRKHQNVQGSLLDRVITIQKAGLVVYGGFIIGFDNDGPEIFDLQIQFITESAIANAMVGPLVALPGTPLFARMQDEGRLLPDTNYADWYESGYTNILTRLSRRILLTGHKRIVENLYDPTRYFERTVRGFQRLPREPTLGGRWRRFVRLAKTELARAPGGVERQKPSVLRLMSGLVEFYRSFPLAFRKPLCRFLLTVLHTCPEQLPRTLSFICMGYHCCEYTMRYTVPKIDEALARPDLLLQQAVPRTFPVLPSSNDLRNLVTACDTPPPTVEGRAGVR